MRPNWLGLVVLVCLAAPWAACSSATVDGVDGGALPAADLLGSPDAVQAAADLAGSDLANRPGADLAAQDLAGRDLRGGAEDRPSADLIGEPSPDLRGGGSPTDGASEDLPVGDQAISIEDAGGGLDAADLAAGDLTAADLFFCYLDNQCGDGEICQAGLCVSGCSAGKPCPGGGTCCNQRCTDTTLDLNNCGICGRRCSLEGTSGASCTNGVCIEMCQPEFADCNHDPTDGCETSMNDAYNNCGICGVGCSTNNAAVNCTAGMCTSGCLGGSSDCNNDLRTDGCETYTLRDPANCGGCGNACSSNNVVNPACDYDVCISSCVAGYADCDNDKLHNGCETLIANDIMNCGGCGVTCSGANVIFNYCLGAFCHGDCQAPFMDCNNNLALDGCELDTSSDPTNCGACGRYCQGTNVIGSACVAGRCTGTCAPGFMDCNGTMTDGCETSIGTEISSCGGCNLSCSGTHITPSCDNGVCDGTCLFGFDDCDHDKLSNGCEADLSSTSSCGACGNNCAAPHFIPTCTNGVCGGTCVPGFGDCDGNPSNGCETPLDANLANCGACGNACVQQNDNVKCIAGVCTPTTCTANHADCDHNLQTNGCEVNTATDPMNCTACGNVCPTQGTSSVRCTNGCGYTCDGTHADCNGSPADACEVSIRDDVNNCGTCGLACSSAHLSNVACAAGGCTGTCNTGWGNCDGKLATNGCETDVTGDPSNCGACGKFCARPNLVNVACVASTCTGTCAAGFADCNNKDFDGCEQNITNSFQNCGGCLQACSSLNVLNGACVNSQCSGTCRMYWADCDNNLRANGCETLIAGSDLRNCGGCGVVCSSNNITTQFCTNGVCSGTCATGFHDCNNDKLTDGCESNYLTDRNNCGTCGTVCPGMMGCFNGRCM